MNKKDIGVKVHDIHHGLIQSTGAIVESEFDILKELGAAIQIATTIKDHEVISVMKPFYAAAGELKISKSLAKQALKHLEVLGYVRLKYETGREDIKRIDILVPSLPDVYTGFGDYFESENKSEMANSLIQIIDKLSSFPHKEKEIKKDIDLENNEYDCLMDIAKSSSLIDSYTSPKDSESVIYSPLYWDDNPRKIFELLEKHKAKEFLKMIREAIKSYQGLPDENVNIDKDILFDAIKLGCLPSLSVNSTSGLKKFIFTPKQGVGKTEKVLLHKARILLSCVRYGENFAGITKIYSPEKLIGALTGKGFLKGHSESLKQYEPARNHGIVKIIPTGNRFEVHFIDNDENKKAVEMAIEMLQVGDTAKYNDNEETAKKILIPGNIYHPTQTRIQVVSEKHFLKSKATIEKVNDILRGVE